MCGSENVLVGCMHDKKWMVVSMNVSNVRVANLDSVNLRPYNAIAQTFAVQTRVGLQLHARKLGLSQIYHRHPYIYISVGENCTITTHVHEQIE